MSDSGLDHSQASDAESRSMCASTVVTITMIRFPIGINVHLMTEPIRMLYVDDDPQLTDLVRSFLQEKADRIEVNTTSSPGRLSSSWSLLCKISPSKDDRKKNTKGTGATDESLGTDLYGYT